MSDQKNYITPLGFKRLQDEWEYFTKVERPEVTRVVSWAAGNGDRSENADYQYGKKRLREIDKRLRFLTKRIDDAEIVDPLKIKSQKIQFGATVTLLDEDGNQKKYTIVGVDEVDTTRSWISWRSPIGRALLGKEVGDSVLVQTPVGETEYEVEALEYKAIPIPEFKPVGGLK